ncbi:hypothetical protein AB1Y20_000178 [Prymnesium parvum]|uniref:ABC transporter domain-containing protein n=1 Tax=Prymnesium parvum TaxID=97485 RepID=A0AB34K7G2_PRYPA
MPPRPAASPLLSLHDVSLAHDDDSPPILTAVTLTLFPGMRLLLRGPTAAGKSTLLAALAGRIPPRHGSRAAARGLQLLWSPHEGPDRPSARDDESAVAFLRRLGEGCGEAAALGALSAAGLDQWAARRAWAALSAGERSLAALAAAPSELLLLDEPALGLGREEARAAAAVLAPEAWEGTLVCASGHEEFCRALRPTHVAWVEGGGVRLVECGASAGGEESDFGDGAS